MELFAAHAIDYYKVGHEAQYDEDTTLVYSNLTARSGKNSNVRNSKGIIFVGLQLFLKDYLIDSWNKTFFHIDEDEAVKKFTRRISNALNQEVTGDKIRSLHKLGYLPLKIKALPEGSFIPYKVPMMTVYNTLPEFYWLTNYIDCVLNQELWPTINSATTMREYLKVFHIYAKQTCDNNDFVPYQGHDFSDRGMFGREAAARSGFAALAAGSYGTDTVHALDVAEDYYNCDAELEPIGFSVPATEHSVMCSNINTIEYSLGFDFELAQKDFFSRLSRKAYEDINDIESTINVRKLVAEFAYVKKLITKIYPTGIVSIVADSYDFWSFVKYILPALKTEILARDGKVVIRPDSGDPVAIITGTFIDKIWDEKIYRNSIDDYKNLEEIAEKIIDDVEDTIIEDIPGLNDDRIFYKFVYYKNKSYKIHLQITDIYWGWEPNCDYERISSCVVHKIEDYHLNVEEMGLIESLYKTFGGSINSKGYIELNPKIGAIYGDSITLDRQNSILYRLKQKGFASNNIVLGIGSYTFQNTTRDTHGIAMKATYCEVRKNGRLLGIPIYKDPKTDDGTKKSARGLLMVERSGDKYSLRDDCIWKEESRGCLETVFHDGKLLIETSLKEIRERVKKDLDAELENI